MLNQMFLAGTSMSRVASMRSDEVLSQGSVGRTVGLKTVTVADTMTL